MILLRTYVLFQRILGLFDQMISQCSNIEGFSFRKSGGQAYFALFEDMSSRWGQNFSEGKRKVWFPSHYWYQSCCFRSLDRNGQEQNSWGICYLYWYQQQQDNLHPQRLQFVEASDWFIAYNIGKVINLWYAGLT